MDHGVVLVRLWASRIWDRGNYRDNTCFIRELVYIFNNYSIGSGIFVINTNSKELPNRRQGLSPICDLSRIVFTDPIKNKKIDRPDF